MVAPAEYDPGIDTGISIASAYIRYQVTNSVFAEVKDRYSGFIGEMRRVFGTLDEIDRESLDDCIAITIRLMHEKSVRSETAGAVYGGKTLLQRVGELQFDMIGFLAASHGSGVKRYYFPVSNGSA